MRGCVEISIRVFLGERRQRFENGKLRNQLVPKFSGDWMTLPGELDE